MPDDNVIWIAEAKIKEGRRLEFEGVMKDLVKVTSQEKGALHYEWYIGEDDREIYIYERYKDLDAAIAHLDTWEKHAHRFMATADFKLLTVLSDLPQFVRDRLAGIPVAYRVPFGGFKKNPTSSNGAYFIFNHKVNDAETLNNNYLPKAVETLEPYDPDLLVVDQNVEIVEGESEANRMVVLRFQNKDLAKKWYNSPGYQSIINLRINSVEGGAILCDAFDPENISN